LNQPLISFSADVIGGMIKRDVPWEEIRRYLPKYLIQPQEFEYGWLKGIWFGILRLVLVLAVWLWLRPRVARVGELDPEEVKVVYSDEADTYNQKHKRTTRGQDLFFRRAIGWFVATLTRCFPGCAKVLDLCTGTGLTVKAITAAAEQWGAKPEVTGLDFCPEMLARAKANGALAKFVLADATALSQGMPVDEGMIQFGDGAFDVVTQMCGIGGIPNANAEFYGVLRVLRPGGSFMMSDIHRPIPQFCGEWPIGLWFARFPVFEAYAYERITLPLVLGRLWGWRDPTMAFYQLPLATYQDDQGQWWGFQVDFFEVESQRWWLALPLMPTGKIICRKVKIDEETARIRRVILEAVSH
jgi:ubiquinone/menaquinone biosynthesis C-methylase UbiE